MTCDRKKKGCVLICIAVRPQGGHSSSSLPPAERLPWRGHVLASETRRSRRLIRPLAIARCKRLADPSKTANRRTPPPTWTTSARKKVQQMRPLPKIVGRARARGSTRSAMLRMRSLARQRPLHRPGDRRIPSAKKTKIFGKTDPQRPRRTRRRAPAAARTCFPWDGPSGVAVGGQRATKAGVSDFFVGAAAPGGLRLPPPSPGSWRTKKNTHTTTNRRKATCGSRWGPSGGHGSDPLRP